jgi:type IV pilus assembly protein PilC
MSTFTYTALNERGRNVRGSMVAENEIDLETRLKEVGLELINYREQNTKTARSAKIKIKDMIVLCLHLEQLSKAGVPIHGDRRCAGFYRVGEIA